MHQRPAQDIRAAAGTGRLDEPLRDTEASKPDAHSSPPGQRATMTESQTGQPPIASRPTHWARRRTLSPGQQALRHARAKLRYARIVLTEFRTSLLIFSGTNLGGALLLWLLYTPKQLRFSEALHATFTMVFLEWTLPEYPRNILLQALTFVVPILGLSVVAEGLIRLGAVLWDQENRREVWEMAVSGTLKDHVIVCGLGRVGRRVVERLLNEGVEVVVIERNRDSPFRKGAEKLGAFVVIGDAKQPEVLERANGANARAFMGLTDDDLTNLESALEIRKLNPSVRTILRMFNESLGQTLSGTFGIDAVFSSTALAAPAFAASVFSDKILHSLEVAGESLHLTRLEIAPGSPLIDRRIGALAKEHDVTFLLHQSPQKHDLIPDPDIILGANDLVMLLARLPEVDLFERLSQLSSEVATGEV